MRLFSRGNVSAGLDIGSGYIKMARIDHSKGEPEILELVAKRLPPGAIVEGQVRDRAAVTETIRSVAERAGVQRGEIVTSVGGHEVIIKTIQMDRMGEADAREVMPWEAEQHVPFDVESVQLDFQVLDPDGPGPRMSVLLAAAKRELIDDRLDLLAGAGLSAALIDVDAFALHNAFEQSYPDQLDGLVALVDVGNESTHVNLLDDGVPVLLRGLPFGLRRLRHTLEHEHALTQDEAEAAVQGRVPGDGTAELRALLARRADELAVGIERTATFITAQSAGREIGRTFLSGGGARVPGLAETVANRLGVPTQIANPLERIPVQPAVMESIAVDELAPLLMLSVGLALRRA